MGTRTKAALGLAVALAAGLAAGSVPARAGAAVKAGAQTARIAAEPAGTIVPTSIPLAAVQRIEGLNCSASQRRCSAIVVWRHWGTEQVTIVSIASPVPWKKASPEAFLGGTPAAPLGAQWNSAACLPTLQLCLLVGTIPASNGSAQGVVAFRLGRHAPWQSRILPAGTAPSGIPQDAAYRAVCRGVSCVATATATAAGPARIVVAASVNAVSGKFAERQFLAPWATVPLSAHISCSNPSGCVAVFPWHGGLRVAEISAAHPRWAGRNFPAFHMRPTSLESVTAREFVVAGLGTRALVALTLGA